MEGEGAENIMMFCKVCNKRLFKVDPDNEHVIRIKSKNREEHVFNLKNKGAKIEGTYKAIKRQGKYLFDHIASHQSVIGMKCYECSTLHLINLEEGTSHLVHKKY